MGVSDSDKPGQRVLTDEELAALAEGRMTQREEVLAVEALRKNWEQRAAFRDLFPGRYRQLFG